MKTLSPDTSAEAEEVQIALLRQAPAWRKLEIAFQLTRSLKNMIRADLQERYPHDDPAMHHRRLAHRWLGSDLASKVYGVLPN